MITQRITVTETQMVLDIIANTDAVPPTEVVEQLITMANKWRYDWVGVTESGVLLSGQYSTDGYPILQSPRNEQCFVLVDSQGIVPAPWSEELIIAIKNAFDLYSLDWLTGG